MMKVKLSEEIEQSAKRIMANHPRDKNFQSEKTDAVYAMARALEIKLEIGRRLGKVKKMKQN